MDATFDFTVDEHFTTNVGDSVTTGVLATPRMIGVMEYTSMQAVWDELPEGATCVGYEVCVKHVASAPAGSRCTAFAELTEVRDGRKLRFDVRVEHDGRTIGLGTHERRVIGAAKFDDFNAATAAGERAGSSAAAPEPAE
ncbi:MAG: thioesterase family protein [Actinobacteria bacterium]|nr:thioesterase family protein [Actinomycetota bacterium]